MEAQLARVLAHLNQVADAAVTQALLAIVGSTVFALSYVAGRGSNRLAHRILLGRDPTLAHLVGGLAAVAIVVPGGLLALRIALPSIHFAELFASLGVASLVLGFALKELLENFVAGTLLLWRRPILIGDEIRFRHYEGIVEEINVRATVLRTFDGQKVFLPNGKLLAEALENLRTYPSQRSTVVLGIDPGASVARARQVTVDTLREIPEVLQDPPVEVLLDALGAYTLDLHVLFWTAAPTHLAELAIRSEVTERLNTALTAAGIGFPVPTYAMQDGNLRLSDERTGPEGPPPF